MTAAQWVKYDGSDEQIAEIENVKNGWLVIFYDGTQSEIHKGYPGKSVNMHAIQKYLICNPHPYADMICQWARTGQPVWVRPKKPYEFKVSDYENHPTTKLMVDNKGVYFITTTPNWNIPGAEYIFTPFEEEL